MCWGTDDSYDDDSDDCDSVMMITKWLWHYVEVMIIILDDDCDHYYDDYNNDYDDNDNVYDCWSHDMCWGTNDSYDDNGDNDYDYWYCWGTAPEIL